MPSLSATAIKSIKCGKLGMAPGFNPVCATQKLLPPPIPEMIARGLVFLALEKKFPEHKFDSVAFHNPMICPDCRITAEHFLAWKNGARYQFWSCGQCEWVSGPWPCPAEYPRFSSQN
jgi:hypothetical protein